MRFGFLMPKTIPSLKIKIPVTPDEIKLFRRSPAEFRKSLLIRNGNETAKFNPDPWQAENLAVLDPMWKRVAGVPVEGKTPKLAFLGRPRGHSKTMDEAMQLTWVLAFSRRHLNGIAAAGSREQAKFIRDAVLRIILLNPWLGKNGLNLIQVQNYRVFNPKTKSEVDIISSDAPSSFGATPDFVLCDELTHWRNDKHSEKGDSSELWESLYSSTDKVKHCILVIMTNAGYEQTWQAEIRDLAKSNKDGTWVYRNLDKVCASWMGADFLERQQAGLSRKAFSRLWLNQWQVEAGDALSTEDIMACVDKDQRPMNGDEEGWVFLAGLDLSTMKHRSAFVILGVHPTEHRIRLALTRSWKPGVEGSVDLQRVRSEVANLSLAYKVKKLLYDPFQAMLMGQDVERAGIWCEPMKFTDPKNLTLMATTILDVFKTHRLEMYEDRELISDLKKLNIVERSGFSFKIEAKADSTGHADTAIALAICLPEAVNQAAIPAVNPFINRSICSVIDESVIDEQNAVQEIQVEGVPVLRKEKGILQKVMEELDLKLEEEEDDAA